jgi:hypothetical protein
MNTEERKRARQQCLSRQVRQLYAVGDDGHRLPDDAGNYYLDLDRAPLVLAALGVGPKQVDARLASAAFTPVDAVLEWTQAMLDGTLDEECILLVGPGSNYTAAAIVGNAVRGGQTAAWYTWHNFTRRYTDRITHDRVLTRGSTEEASSAAEMLTDAEGEEEYLSEVYDVLALIEFDINDVRDFAVPEICALIRMRTSLGLATVVTVPTANSEALEISARNFGGRGSLLQLFEHEARVFDGRQ